MRDKEERNREIKRLIEENRATYVPARFKWPRYPTLEKELQKNIDYTLNMTKKLISDIKASK